MVIMICPPEIVLRAVSKEIIQDCLVHALRIPDSLTREEGSVDEVVKQPRQRLPPV